MSKYFMSPEFETQDLDTIASTISRMDATRPNNKPKPVVEKRRRAPRKYTVYTYRDQRFIMLHGPNDRTTVCHLSLNSNKAEPKVIVPKAKARIAVHALVRIIEAEQLLDTLKTA